MPPNRDEVAAVGANRDSRSVETPTFVADFCLIDDPPEYEDQLGELDAEDEAERPVNAGAAMEACRTLIGSYLSAKRFRPA